MTRVLRRRRVRPWAVYSIPGHWWYRSLPPRSYSSSWVEHTSPGIPQLLCHKCSQSALFPTATNQRIKRLRKPFTECTAINIYMQKLGTYIVTLRFSCNIWDWISTCTCNACWQLIILIHFLKAYTAHCLQSHTAVHFDSRHKCSIGYWACIHISKTSLSYTKLKSLINEVQSIERQI